MKTTKCNVRSFAFQYGLAVARRLYFWLCSSNILMRSYTYMLPVTQTWTSNKIPIIFTCNFMCVINSILIFMCLISFCMINCIISWPCVHLNNIEKCFEEKFNSVKTQRLVVMMSYYLTNDLCKCISGIQNSLPCVLSEFFWVPAGMFIPEKCSAVLILIWRLLL